jgi:hypothetical protein
VPGHADDDLSASDDDFGPSDDERAAEQLDATRGA